MTKGYDRVPEAVLCKKRIRVGRVVSVTIQLIHSRMGDGKVSFKMRVYGISTYQIHNDFS